MSWFRLTVFIAGGFSLASTSTVNAQLFRRLGAENACLPVQNCPSITYYSTSTPCATMIAQSRCETSPPCFESRCVTDNVCVQHMACEPQCPGIETCTVMVPYTVEQTKSYTVSDPTAQLKEDIKRVKDKLDTIQPGPDPSLKTLQDDLKEIKDLLKKTPTPTSRVRDRVDNCERLVASMVQREYRLWLDAAEQRRVQAKLISHDSRRVVIERADGKVFSVELEKLSKSDQEFALAIH